MVTSRSIGGEEMKTVLATFAMMAMSVGAQAASSEGRVSELSKSNVEPARIAKYEGHTNAGASLKRAGELQKGAEMIPAQKQVRPAAVQKSEKASYFYFYDAHSSLQSDRDGDGYHSEFTIRFDADTTLGDQLVYAKLYLRRVGESDWTLYHVTDDFWINGESNDDDFYVRTTLDDGFGTSEYDVLIDLYDASTSDVVATIDYNNAGELGLLPLEESGLDVPIEESGFSIGDAHTTLLIDDDQDGHYSKFEIAFDPNADVQPGNLYARVWIRPQGGEWIQEHVSENFPVDTSGQDDVYAFTADWVSGYPTAYYDVQIDLYDASTDLLVASAGSERQEFSRIPLEDQTRDQKPSAPITGGGGAVTSHEHGGGALATTWLVLLALLALFRRILLTRSAVRID
jgi:hypothetical protein